MDWGFGQLLADTGLTPIANQLFEAALLAISMSLSRQAGALPSAASKFGGRADLPADFNWPSNKGRLLDFLLQINLADVHPFESQQLLPATGLLTFFYDLNDQPWGFDPAELEGFRVIYTPNCDDLRSHDTRSKLPI